MAITHRIFISFAIEDSFYRDGIVHQAKDERSTFSFVDMSVKELWDEKWKTNCRTKIKGCDGMIVMVSKNIAKATGALWEVKCAKEEGVPARGIYTSTSDRPLSLPPELSGVRVADWTWKNISAFLDTL